MDHGHCNTRIFYISNVYIYYLLGYIPNTFPACNFYNRHSGPKNFCNGRAFSACNRLTIVRLTKKLNVTLYLVHIIPQKRFLLLLLDKFGLQDFSYIALLIIGSKSGTILFPDTQFDYIMLRNTFTIFTIYSEKRVSNEKPSPHIKGKINL